MKKKKDFDELLDIFKNILWMFLEGLYPVQFGIDHLQNIRKKIRLILGVGRYIWSGANSG